MCYERVQGDTCSELQENSFFRGIDFLILEAEDATGSFDAVVVTDGRNRLVTGTGSALVEQGATIIDFGSLTPPGSGLYEVVIRYTLQGALVWDTATLTILPSADEGAGPANCINKTEIIEESSFEYTGWMFGSGLSVYRPFCFRAGRSYQFVLSNFSSGRDDDSAVLNIDSLVLIPVDLPQLAVFQDPVMIRDYRECVALFRSLATQPSDPFTCRDIVFAVSIEVYSGAAGKIHFSLK